MYGLTYNGSIDSLRKLYESTVYSVERTQLGTLRVILKRPVSNVYKFDIDCSTVGTFRVTTDNNLHFLLDVTGNTLTVDTLVKRGRMYHDIKFTRLYDQLYPVLFAIIKLRKF